MIFCFLNLHMIIEEVLRTHSLRVLSKFLKKNLGDFICGSFCNDFPNIKFIRRFIRFF